MYKRADILCQQTERQMRRMLKDFHRHLPISVCDRLKSTRTAEKGNGMADASKRPFISLHILLYAASLIVKYTILCFCQRLSRY